MTPIVFVTSGNGGAGAALLWHPGTAARRQSVPEKLADTIEGDHTHYLPDSTAATTCCACTVPIRRAGVPTRSVAAPPLCDSSHALCTDTSPGTIRTSVSMTSAAVHDAAEMRVICDGRCTHGHRPGTRMARSAVTPSRGSPRAPYFPPHHCSAGCLLYSASCVCNHSMLIGDTRMLSAPNGDRRRRMESPTVTARARPHENNHSARRAEDAGHQCSMANGRLPLSKGQSDVACKFLARSPFVLPV
jgi:hypothetical protein